MTAVAASVLTAVVHRSLADDSVPPVAVANVASDFALPTSGVVVTLSRPGFTDLPIGVGLDSAFVVSVVGAEPVAAIELVAGPEVVDRVVLDEPAPGHTARLTWRADRTGPTTLVARAYGVDGNVGQSNPVRVDARSPDPISGLTTITPDEGATLGEVARRVGTDATTIADLNGLTDVAPDAPLPAGTTLEVPIALTESAPQPADGTGPSSLRRAGPTGRRSFPPLPADLSVAPPPAVEAQVDGCTATVKATPGTEGQSLFLLQVPPTGGAFTPIAELHDAPVTLALTSGAHDLVVAAGDGTSLVAWSDLVSLPEVDEGCSGWSGSVRLTGGRLVADTDAESAYLYLSTSPGEWIRVPAEGSVPRGTSGFDFSGLLPPLTGSALELEAWGRAGGSLVEIGTGSFAPPNGGSQAPGGPVSAISDGIPFPKAQLWWLRPADWKHGGDPPKAVTSGEVPEPATLQFQWVAPISGVTHGIVQVTSAAIPPTAGPKPGGILYQSTVLGNGGTFEIDFEKVVATSFAKQNGTLVEAGAGSPQQLYQAIAGILGNGSGTTTSSITASPHPLDLDPTDDLDLQEALAQLFVVRVVPMTSDTWTGLVTNDVTLQVDPSGAYPVAPAGERPYELDVALVGAPKPPDPSKMSCWQFAGWTDDDALQQALAEEAAAAKQGNGPNLGTYTVWKALVDNVGSGPICAGCYHVGSLTISVAGADCSDSGFVGDLFDAFKTFVNMLSSTFAFIKAQIVDLVVSATGCKAAGDTAASICSTLATAALDAALVSLGIPPSLPNWDQLVAAAKGDIVELGVGLATQLGVPCDEADFAAEVHGDEDLTCEGALEALLDEAIAQIDQLYRDTAESMGFGFPPLMRVRPHPAGQVGPAEVEVTVNPTKYTAAEGGHTCSVGVYSKSVWAGKIDLATTALVGKQIGGPIVSGIVPGFAGGISTTPYKIPQLFWSGTPFEANYWDLPDLKTDPNTLGTYLPASRTYQLYPPLDTDSVQVSALYPYEQAGVTDSQGKPAYGVSQFWATWPESVFLLNEGAFFKLLVTSGCASGTGFRTWKLPGFGLGPAVEVGG